MFKNKTQKSIFRKSFFLTGTLIWALSAYLMVGCSSEEKKSDLVYNKVLRVIDGDTLEVETQSGKEKVRVIGLDTPETKDRRRPVECFGKEASEYAKKLLEGQEVVLEQDPTQGDRDKFKRLLRYVFLKNGENFSLKMIQAGYGFEYTYQIPHKYQEEFQNAEREARESQVGLWADGACADKVKPRRLLKDSKNKKDKKDKKDRKDKKSKKDKKKGKKSKDIKK